MTTYYINGASATEDGLTPATGYHNFTNLMVAIGQGTFFNDGDIIECVQGDIAEEGPEAINLQSTGVLTIRSYLQNTSRPKAHLYHGVSQFACNSNGQGSEQFSGIDFYGVPGCSIAFYGGLDTDICSFDKCRFFDVAIEAFPGGGS
jgi:hypothetical protein